MFSCLLLPSASAGSEAKPLVAQRADVKLQVLSQAGSGQADLSYLLEKDYKDLILCVPKVIAHRNAIRQQLRVTQCHLHKTNTLSGEHSSHSFELVRLDTAQYSTMMNNLPRYDEIKKQFRNVVSSYSGAHSCEDLLLHVGNVSAHTELSVQLEFLVRFDSPSITTFSTSISGTLPPTINGITKLQYVVLNKLPCRHLFYTLNLASALPIEDVSPSDSGTSQLKWEFTSPSTQNVIHVAYKAVSTADDSVLASQPVLSGFTIHFASGKPSACCTSILCDSTRFTKLTSSTAQNSVVHTASELLACDALMMLDTTLTREQLPMQVQQRPLFPSEFVFVIDCSGSMSGTNIQMAADTLITCVKSLPQGSFFNVIAFGSKFRHLFHTSTEYSKNSVDRALQFANQLQASLGGTELLDPLRWIFKKPRCDDLPRQVFIVTDGGVTNTQYVLHTVRKNRHQARCHTFGIGSDVCLELVTGIASASGGACVVLKEGERLQTKVMEVITKSLEPTVTDTVLRWNPPEGYTVIDSTPKNLNSLYTGSTSTAYALLRKTMPHSNGMSPRPLTDVVATIAGKVCGEQVEIPVHQAGLPLLTTNQSATFSSMLVQGALWSKLNDLEMLAFSSSRKNSQNDDKLQEPAAKRPRLNGMSHYNGGMKHCDTSTQEELVRVSLQSHIPCGLTHFQSSTEDQTMTQILPYKRNASSSHNSILGTSKLPRPRQQVNRRHDRKGRHRGQLLKGRTPTQLSVSSFAKSTITAVGSTLKSMVGITFGMVCGDVNQSMEIGQTIDDELEYQTMKDSRIYWDDSEGGKLVYPPMYYQSRDSTGKSPSLHSSANKSKQEKRNQNGTTTPLSLNSVYNQVPVMLSVVPPPLNGITPATNTHHQQIPTQAVLLQDAVCTGEDDDFTISDTESDSSVDPDWGDLRRPNELLPLIHMQLFTGAWPMVRAFSYAVGVPLDEIRKLPLRDAPCTAQTIAHSSPNATHNQSSSEDDVKAHFWCTALALACFEEYFAHLRPEWELVALKGRLWLEQNLEHCQLSIVDIRQTAKELVLRQS